jgi:hypothetical protein
MALDLPSIGTSNYTTSAYALNAGGIGYVGNEGGIAGQWFDAATTAAPHTLVKRQVSPQVSTTTKPVIMDMPEKNVSRFVRVIIVDPNENLSLEDRLVYKGEEKFTDLNDQELFFELEIKTLLSAHNEKRVKTVDKSVKERTEHLEPAKIRDLKMVVVNIATF